MSFFEFVKKDLETITLDTDYGFAREINLIDPNGYTKVINCYTNDISFMIDPDTGQAVTGRTATVLILISALKEAGFNNLPAAQSDTTKKPWIVKFNDLNNVQWTFSIKEGNPDRTLNLIFCTLEFFKE